MIHSESSSDPHATEDDRRRANTRNTGWRLPRELIREVKAHAKQEGLQPGAFVTRALRRHYGHPQEHVFYGKDLEARIRFPSISFTVNGHRAERVQREARVR